MPNPGGFGELGLEHAALQVEAALRTELPCPVTRLDRAELDRLYLRRQFAKGWRMEFEFSDGKVRSIDLLIGSSFPSGYPRTALVNGPGQLIWPHVEYDGVMCLLPLAAEIDAEKPGDVAINLITRSVRLIEELIEGTIVELDFREEFLTYWAYSINGRGRVHSLITPHGPSREVRVWRDGKGLTVVGEDKASLERWLTRRYGKNPGRKSFQTEVGALLWLAAAPLPADYPYTGADLIRLAERSGAEAVELLVNVAARLKEVTVLVGAEGRGGPGLAAASTTAHKRAPERHGRVEAPLTKGFQSKILPKEIAALRTYSAAPVERMNVQRADAAWIHGRGKDQRSDILLGKSIVLIGAGSVGSSVATRLIRAGVGTIDIVDHDALSWPNVGRHELGAGSIGHNKATELAAKLQADFPHLTVKGHALSAQTLIDADVRTLAEANLIIAATGSWDAEGALNRWHLSQDRANPILYGWTESHAMVGHAVVIGARGGCLRCGIGPTGVPDFVATSWREGMTLVEEPACGNHFNPYGAVELGFIVDLIADAALMTLLDPVDTSREVIWLAPQSHLAAAGGTWSDQLIAEMPDVVNGGRRIERAWAVRACQACGEAPASAAA